MLTRNSATAYGWVAQCLHWSIAALVITQFVLGQLAGGAGDDGLAVRQLALLANHKSIGMTVLLLAIIRICWRWGSPVPVLPPSLPRWQVGASRTAHWLLYLLIFALPISGWLMSSASAYSVSWFNLLELPDLVSASEALKERLVNVHHLLATTLFVVAIVHALAALKHQFFDRDDVLRRMLSGASGALFVVVLAGAVWAATDVGKSGPVQALPMGPEASTPALESVAVATTVHGNPEIAPWRIDYSSSYIRFRAEQAGASFEGRWSDWRADIRFLADSLEASSAVVEIDVATVSTGDRQRDETLLAADWFAANEFSTVSFSSDDFMANGDGAFTANANLSIKKLTTPVRLVFSLAENQAGDRWILEGSTRLDRLAMQLGTGEWADPTWVGQFVDVQVHVEASAQPGSPAGSPASSATGTAESKPSRNAR